MVRAASKLGPLNRPWTIWRKSCVFHKRRTADIGVSRERSWTKKEWAAEREARPLLSRRLGEYWEVAQDAMGRRNVYNGPIFDDANSGRGGA